MVALRVIHEILGVQVDLSLTPTGSNGAGIETFLDNIPMSLTREVLQNSIDAHQRILMRLFVVSLRNLRTIQSQRNFKSEMN